MSGSSDQGRGEPDPRIGTLLAERYRIDALVGEGGMGKVYSAEHVLMRKRLAVKVLRRELTSVPEVVARFEREAMAAANIEHPNVAAATDFGKLPDGAVFLVLEFVSGRSLRDEIARGPFAVERALHVARQIGAALAAAHQQGIVHRDLKPENVMLVEKGADPDFVKVLDFGVAKVPFADLPGAAQLKNPITKAGMVFGTPEYMAPEQALGENVDGRADLYALGVILFEMLSGSRPFSSQSSVGILGQQLSKPPPTFLERAPGVSVPPATEQIAHRLLHRESSGRFATAGELVQAIDALLGPLPGQAAYRYTLSDGFPRAAPVSDPAQGGAGPVFELRRPDPLLDDPAKPGRSPASAALTSAWQRSVELARALDLRRNQRAGDRARGAVARLPRALQNRFNRVPPGTRLRAGAALGVLLLLGLWIAFALSRRAPVYTPSATRVARVLAVRSAAPAVSPPLASALPLASRASQIEVEQAEKSGTPGLEALSAKYPTDPQPVLELAREEVAARDYEKAVTLASRALTLDPSLSDSKQLESILFQTAQVKAASEQSFGLLFGALGEHGPDVAYDLAVTEAVKPWVRARADQWLRKSEFERLATPALKSAVALRFSTSCHERYALLPSAQAAGDQRALAYLKMYRVTTGCGHRHREDCNPCLRADTRLADGIAAITARTAK